MQSLFRLSISALVVLLFASSCGLIGGGTRITGSGPLVSDNRRLLDFNEVTLDAGVDLVIIQGNEQSVNVNAQSEIQPVLNTEVNNEKLTIALGGKNVNMDGGSNVEIVIPELEQLRVNGSGNVIVRGFKGDKLQVESSSSGSISVVDATYDKVELKLSGSGDVDLTGAGDNLDISTDASGDVDAYDFESEDAKIMSKGSGDVRVMVSDNLDAEIKGSGSIYYRGDPEVKLKDEGAGELKPEN